MSSIHIAEPAIEAINILANNAVSKAGFDKTIKATVKELLDKPTGKYKIKYQDSEFQAYAGSFSVYYEEGQQVSILIPGGDWDRTKVIIGGKPGSAMVYKQMPVADEQYNSLGPNGIKKLNKQIQLSSYQNNAIMIYPPEESYVTLSESVSKYIKSGNCIVLSMVVRTDLKDTQIGGHYGVAFNLKFRDSIQYEEDAEEGQIVYTNKTFEVSDFDLYNGNSYRLQKAVKISALISNIDTQNFVGIEFIQAYCKGFPENKSITTPDIFISEIGINGAALLEQDELTGYILHINDPQGGVLEGQLKTLPLQAQLKVQGQLITENVRYYWFIQDGRIFRGNEGYSSYAGEGWRCLNPPVGVSGTLYSYFTDPKFYFTSQTRQLDINQYQLPLKVNKVLCVAQYNNRTVKGEYSVVNSEIKNNIYIDSSDKKDGENKTEYFLGNGHPTLTCRVLNDEGEQIDYTTEDSNYIFNWSIQPANGEAINQMENDNVLKNIFTVSENATLDGQLIEAGKFWNYDKLTDEQRQELVRFGIVSGEYYDFWNNYYAQEEQIELADENAAEVLSLPFDGEQLKTKECIDGNKYINFPINSITNYTKIVCAVSQKKIDQITGQEVEIYRGSASITLYNKMQLEGQYSLSINNGTQIFQYNEKGNSPFVAEVDRKPLEKVPALSFSLLDDTGSQISYNQITEYGSVRWLFPKNDTLLTTEQKNYINEKGDLTLNSTDTALAADFYIYKNQPTFSYSIEDRFSLNKTNNNIGLLVNFKDLSFETWTDFTFPKNGDPGTNGTKLIAKIIPQRSGQDLSTDRVYATKVGSDSIFFTDTGGGVDNLGFFVYNNNEVIYNSADFWSCPPKAIYNNQSQIEGKTFIKYSLNETTRELSLINVDTHGRTIDDIISWSPINIIRGQYGKGNDDATKYYAEYPICYQHILIEGHEDRYRIKVKPKTGFKYVTYAADGTRPDYDNAKPFDIFVEKHISVEQENGTEEGYYTKSGIDIIECTWDTIGSISVDEEKSIDLPSNQRYFKPADEFNGLDLTTAIIVSLDQIKDGSEIINDIGFIHIPIYMNLNRYGNNAINGWDGNSIDLGDTNGGTILAPQVGAGRKEPESNTFTGVLIGQQKTGNNSEVGLFGYNFGERSIFLDAQSGKAEFGKQGNGKVTIDPNLKVRRKSNVNWNDAKQVGLLYSGNYTLPSIENIPNSSKKGITLDVDTYTSNTGGMVIDLSTPQIGFGSGNFRVNPEGHITAKGGGSIAGWNITDDRLYKNNTGMASGNFPASSIGANLPSSTSSIAFYAGTSTAKNNFYVTHDGYLYSKLGKIATWNIDKDKLYNNNVGMGAGPASTYFYNNDQSKVGISSPRFWAGASTNLTFATDSDGKLYSKAGMIGPWSISDSYLTNGKVGMGGLQFENTANSTYNPFNASFTARFWGASDSLTITTKDSNNKKISPKVEDNNKSNIEKLNFAITDNGFLYAKAGKVGGWNLAKDRLWAGSSASGSNGIRIFSNGSMDGKGNNGNWSISSNGTASFNGITATNATVTGNITANTLTANSSGTIGGWKIGTNTLTGKNIELQSNGSLKHTGGNWEIFSNGDAKFNNLYGTVKTGESLSSSGGTGGTGGSWNMPGGGGSPEWTYDNKTMTPQTIKSFTKLNLHRMELISGKNIYVMTNPTDQKVATYSANHNVNVTGSITDSTGGTCTFDLKVSVPNLSTVTLKKFGTANMNTNKIVDGWGTVDINQWEVMASSIDDATKDVEED